MRSVVYNCDRGQRGAHWRVRAACLFKAGMIEGRVQKCARGHVYKARQKGKECGGQNGLANII